MRMQDEQNDKNDFPNRKKIGCRFEECVCLPGAPDRSAVYYAAGNQSMNSCLPLFFTLKNQKP